MTQVIQAITSAGKDADSILSSLIAANFNRTVRAVRKFTKKGK